MKNYKCLNPLICSHSIAYEDYYISIETEIYNRPKPTIIKLLQQKPVFWYYWDVIDVGTKEIDIDEVEVLLKKYTDYPYFGLRQLFLWDLSSTGSTAENGWLDAVGKKT